MAPLTICTLSVFSRSQINNKLDQTLETACVVINQDPTVFSILFSPMKVINAATVFQPFGRPPAMVLARENKKSFSLYEFVEVLQSQGCRRSIAQESHRKSEGLSKLGKPSWFCYVRGGKV